MAIFSYLYGKRGRFALVYEAGAEASDVESGMCIYGKMADK